MIGQVTLKDMPNTNSARNIMTLTSERSHQDGLEGIALVDVLATGHLHCFLQLGTCVEIFSFKDR